jgi:23S rRNA pseudouridine1911/1915/1917 synthase
VHGKVAKDWDVLTFPIARSENADRMAARPLSVAQTTTTPPSLLLERGGTATSPSYQEGARGGVAEDGAKDAKTEFFVEKRFVNFTLLKVILHTGRMHQIRVHMLAYNHPLVGDPLYFQKKRKKKVRHLVLFA